MSGEMTAFDVFDGKGVYASHSIDPPNAISPSEYELFGNVAHEHPMSPSVFQEKETKPLMTNDFLTTAQFHRTAIYNEFYRLLNVDHQLILPLQVSPDCVVTCTHNRTRTGFSAEERELMGLIALPIKTAILNSLKVKKLMAVGRDLNAALKDEPRGALSFGRQGELLHASTTAERLLRAYYENDKSRRDGVPLHLVSWVESCSAMRQHDPAFSQMNMSLEREHSTLHLTLIFDETKGEKLIVLEETRKSSPSNLSSLGLTARQAEVLFWVCRGKTDKDIAGLLGISHRTVHKHLENIYVILGVETRTAAMSVGMSKM
jgi:DNA-binding CsgD family transcriptional regulator